MIGEIVKYVGEILASTHPGDFYDNSFGKTYGLLMEEWHLLARAVLVLDETDTVTYVEYLDNINSDPDYQAAVDAVKAL